MKMEMKIYTLCGGGSGRWDEEPRTQDEGMGLPAHRD